MEGGRSSINHLDNQDSAASISARTDTSNIQHNGDEVNSQTYLSGENSESSKVQKYAESIDNSQIENPEKSVEKSVEKSSKELNESINNDIPVMPNVSDLQHSESNEVQILKKEVDELKAALKQVQSQFEHQKKENNTLRQENELLKGKNNNINATQNVKETGEEREIRIPHQLRDMIIMQAMKNPWRQDLSAFVFFSKTRADRPMDTDAWAVYMRRALKSIGYPNPEKICFHSFRQEISEFV